MSESLRRLRCLISDVNSYIDELLYCKDRDEERSKQLRKMIDLSVRLAFIEGTEAEEDDD